MPTVSPRNTKFDKNLYAYCDNNPVSRKDEGGECWHLLIGAAVGAISQFMFDVGSNIIAGRSITDFKMGSWADYGTAALSGMLAASGVGLVGSIFGNAGLSALNYLANCEKENEKSTVKGLLILNVDLLIFKLPFMVCFALKLSVS